MLSLLTIVKKQVEILQDTWACICMVHLSSFIYSLTNLSFSKSLTLLLISHSSKTCQVKPVHRHTSMYTHVHAHTCIHILVRVHARTHTHACMHARTHTHTHTPLSLTSDCHHNIYKQCPSTEPANQLTNPETGQFRGIRINKNYFYNYAGN